MQSHDVARSTDEDARGTKREGNKETVARSQAQIHIYTPHDQASPRAETRRKAIFLITMLIVLITPRIMVMRCDRKKLPPVSPSIHL